MKRGSARAALVLAAGRAVRMGVMCERIPKPMLPVGGLPFLHWIVEWLCRNEVSVLIGAGHLGERIEDYFSTPRWTGLDVRVVREPVPLGTGGLVRFGENLVDGDELLVLNGDTLLSFDVEDVLRFHRSHDSPVTQLLTKESPQNQGAIVVDKGRVIRFEEGGAGVSDVGGSADRVRGVRLSSTGCYVFDRTFVRQEFPPTRSDLTQELLPGFARRGLVRHHPTIVPKIWDIGTPERYREVEADVTLMRSAYVYLSRGSPVITENCG